MKPTLTIAQWEVVLAALHHQRREHMDDRRSVSRSQPRLASSLDAKIAEIDSVITSLREQMS